MQRKVAIGSGRSTVSVQAGNFTNVPNHCIGEHDLADDRNWVSKEAVSFYLNLLLGPRSVSVFQLLSANR